MTDLFELKNRIRVLKAYNSLLLQKFNPDQERDEHGRWTSEGGGGSSEDSEKKVTDLYKPPTKTAEQVIAEHPGAAEKIQEVRGRLAAGTPTNALVSEGGFKNPDGTYTAERQALHEKIVNDMFTDKAVAAATPAEGEKPVLTVLGGRGGSGKSWLTKSENAPIDESKAVLLDADDVKKHLGSKGWDAALYHEESSDVLDLADKHAMAHGVNVIHDATMKSESTIAMRMAKYQAAGYEVEGAYMHAPVEVAASRALSRFEGRDGKWNGRFVPPEVIYANTDNEKNFMKASRSMRKWSVYDNSGKAPRFVASGGR